MSMKKAIDSGKEHRRRNKRGCRAANDNRRTDCEACAKNRTHAARKRLCDTYREIVRQVEAAFDAAETEEKTP